MTVIFATNTPIRLFQEENFFVFHLNRTKST